ncbi:hypothetical protein Lalb_Chr20g0116701 [Lupinus albus]|uniref:Uncharacterized protein n=1 Tax=Lupinus albus TaxID=3870 RepID=A0A6A4NX21_LUPAL|nr:hypothetical protein Lalb_Chr20g0116701 [Lupinus albus]
MTKIRNFFLNTHVTSSPNPFRYSIFLHKFTVFFFPPIFSLTRIMSLHFGYRGAKTSLPQCSPSHIVTSRHHKR